MADKNVRLRITGDPTGAVEANKKVKDSLSQLGQAELNHNKKSDELAKKQIKILQGIASISQKTRNDQQKDFKAIASRFGDLSQSVNKSVTAQKQQFKELSDEFKNVTGVIKSQAKIQEQQLKLIEKGFQSLKNESDKATDSTKKNSKGITDSLESIRNKAAITFTAVSASIGMVTKTFADFESQMNTFESISGSTREQMRGISSLAMEIGGSTKFSASQVLAASTEVARMGFVYEDITKAMDGFVTTAIASNVSIEESAELVGKTIRGFKLQANEAGRVGDIMTAAMNKSALGFQDLNLSMKYIGPAAASTNQSLETMTGLLGLMADQGIKGEQAGTSMRSMLLRLVNPTDDVSGLIKKLGIDIKDANGNMRGLDDIMNQVRESSAKYEPTVRAQIAATIFGTEAYSAAAAVLGATKDQTDDYIRSVSNVNGISKEQAKIMQQGVSNAMIQLQSQIESTAIAWGKEFAPAAELSLGFVKDIMKVFEDMPNEAKQSSAQIGILVGSFAGIATIASTMGLIKKGIDAIGLSAALASPKLTAFWTAASGPVGWTAGAAGLALNTIINASADQINQQTDAVEKQTEKVKKFNDLLGEANRLNRDLKKATVQELSDVSGGLKGKLGDLNKRKDEIQTMISMGANAAEFSTELDNLAKEIRRYNGLQTNINNEISRRAKPSAPSAPGTEGAGDLFDTAGGKGPSDKIKNLIDQSKDQRDRMATELFNAALKDAGKATEKITVQSMVPGGIWKSGFGPRDHPVTGQKGKPHTGIDYGVPVGTPVLAPSAGTVAFSGTLGGYGNTVIVDLGGGKYVLAAHNSKLTKAVGDTVKKGEQIALSGGAKGAPGSGTSTGPHLHGEIRTGPQGLRNAAAFSGTVPIDPTMGAQVQSFNEQAAKTDAERKAIAQQLVKLKQALNGLDAKSATYAADKKALEDEIYKLTTDNTKTQTDALKEQLKQQEEARKLAEQIEKDRLKAVDDFRKESIDAFKSISDENKRREAEYQAQFMSPLEKQKAAYAAEIKVMEDALSSMNEELEALKPSLTLNEYLEALGNVGKAEKELAVRKEQQKRVIDDMTLQENLQTIELQRQVKLTKERIEEEQRGEHITSAIAENQKEVSEALEEQRKSINATVTGFYAVSSAIGTIRDVMAQTSKEAAAFFNGVADFASGTATAVGGAASAGMQGDIIGVLASGLKGAENYLNATRGATDFIMDAIMGQGTSALSREYVAAGDFSISFDEFKKKKVEEAKKVAKETAEASAKEVEKVDNTAYESYRKSRGAEAEKKRLVEQFTGIYSEGNTVFAEQIQPIIESAAGEWMAIIDDVNKAFAGRSVEERNLEMARRLSKKREDLEKNISEARIKYTQEQEAKLHQQREKNLNKVGEIREKIFKDSVSVHEKEISNFEREIDVLEQRKESLRDDIDALNQEEKDALSKFDVQDKAQFNRMVAGANVSARVQQALDEYINMQQLPMDRTSLRTQREALDQLLALDEQRNETAFLLEDKSAEAYVTTQKDLIAQRAQFLKLQMTDESLSVKERVGLNKEYADLYVQYKEIEQQAIRDKYDTEREKVNDSIELLDREQESIRDRIQGEQDAVKALTATYESEMLQIKTAVDAVRNALSDWSPAIEKVKTDLTGAMNDANVAAEQFVSKINSAEIKLMRERASNSYGRASAGSVPVSPVRTNEYTIQGNNGWYISSSDMQTAEGNFFNGGIVPDGHPRDTFRANLRSKEMVLPPNIASHITRSMNTSVRKENNLNLTVYARTKADAEIIGQVVQSQLKAYDKGNVNINGNYYSPLY